MTALNDVTVSTPLVNNVADDDGQHLRFVSFQYDEYFDDVDLEIDIEMPETPVPPRSARPLPGGGQQTGLRKTPSKLSLNAPDTVSLVFISF